MDDHNHIHSFEDTVVPASCQEAGYTLHRCACGYEYKDQFIPKTAHLYEVVEHKEPACAETGFEKLCCSVCGDPQTRTIPAAGHNWGHWNVRTEPTCTEEGKQFRSCTRCGVQQEQPVKATGHSWSSWTVRKAPKIDDRTWYRK